VTRAMAAILTLALLAACDEPRQAAAPPPPAELGREAVGHYCGMILADHEGPKAQAWVAGIDQPYWFSSVRDAIAFTMLPEEPDAIAAIYVSDMATAESWRNPGTWVEAREAHFVIGSEKRGGMGQMEAVPFSDPQAAADFAAEHGGRVVPFAAIPRDYVLGSDEPPGEAHGGHQ